MSERLERLQDALLVQCSLRESAAALELAKQPGAGVVVTGPRIRRQDVWALADLAGRAGTPLLVDAAAYAGSARRPASTRFDPAWLQWQRDAGLPVLSDSGYIGDRDDTGLDNVLGQARAAGDVVATLPLDAAWWFHPDRGLPRLLDRVRDAGVAVALVLEHRDDPFGVARTLRGVLELLHVGVPVLHLRCDVSGLGLICHGAHAAAVGTSTGRRHLSPQSTRPGGFVRAASVATLVRDCLSFIAVDKIALAVAADPEDSLWTACVCPACMGRQLDAIAQAPPHEQPAWAFGHALHALFELRDHIVGRTVDPGARQESWRAHCDSASARFDELHDTGQGWKPPPFLRHWLTVPVRSRAPDLSARDLRY